MTGNLFPKVWWESDSEPVSEKETTARWAGAGKLEARERESPISQLVKVSLQTEEKQEAPEAGARAPPADWADSK